MTPLHMSRQRRPLASTARRGRPRHLTLTASVQARDVVYFRLDANRRPLLSAMIAAAIVQDC